MANNAPKDIVPVLRECVKEAFGQTTKFLDYYNVFKFVWPHIVRADADAALGLAIDCYMEIADQEGFKVDICNLRRA